MTLNKTALGGGGGSLFDNEILRRPIFVPLHYQNRLLSRVPIMAGNWIYKQHIIQFRAQADIVDD